MPIKLTKKLKVCQMGCQLAMPVFALSKSLPAAAKFAFAKHP